MRVIFIFIDGFGLGENDTDRNPILAARTPNLDYIFKNFTVIPTDATLGVEGLPQSATGQTVIFTGVNGAKALGRHLSGQPTETLKKIIYDKNLFNLLIGMGLKVTNANVYREEYLSKILSDESLGTKERRLRPSVTTVMTLSSGGKFRTVSDYKKGNGVYHDITGKIIKESGYDVDLIQPDEAAKRLYSISRGYDFTLYEHFMTDIIGHTMDMKLAIEEIELLDAFLGELVRLVDLQEDIIFITSDHGNIEDISVRTHTYNKVPTIIMGNIPHNIDIGVKSLMDIVPTVVEIFKNKKE